VVRAKGKNPDRLPRETCASNCAPPLEPSELKAVLNSCTLTSVFLFYVPEEVESFQKSMLRGPLARKKLLITKNAKQLRGTSRKGTYGTPKSGLEKPDLLTRVSDSDRYGSH